MKVVHVRDRRPGAVRIDRTTKWGNPFVIGKDGSRQQVIEKYRAYLWLSPLINDLHELFGKDLECWCAPLPCHGDVIAEVLAYPAEEVES